MLLAVLAVLLSTAFPQTSDIRFGDKFMTVTPYDDNMVFRTDAWYTNAFAYKVEGKDMFKIDLRKKRKNRDVERKVSYKSWPDGEYVVGVEDKKSGRIEMLLFRIDGDSVKVVFDDL